MAGVVSVDVSEFQPPVDDSYNREWFIFRACDGDYTDRNAVRNLAWAVKARAAGKIRGFTVYVVYRPGKLSASLAILENLGVPRDCVVMLDVESWGGQIVGDHSADANDFATKLRARQSGRADLVWAYGNRGPDLTVWPNKPDWLEWEVASYGGSNPGVSNEAGWQYTDGTYDVPGLPSSTPPFGRCDHNELFKLPEEDVALDPKDPVIVALNNKVDALAAAVGNANGRLVSALNGDTDHPGAGLRDLAPVVAKIASQVQALSASSGVDPAALAAAIAEHVGLVAK